MDQHEQQDLEDILAMAQSNCWDPHGDTIIRSAIKVGFDPTEVEDDSRNQLPSRFDSRGGTPWSFGGSASGSTRPPILPRVLHRTDTEEELRRIRNRQELYQARRQLHEAEVQDANRTATDEHTMAANIRVPKAPAAPDGVLAVLQDLLPLAAVRQAQMVMRPGSHSEVEASKSLVSLARQAQQARLTPSSGQEESEKGQRALIESEAMQGSQAMAEVATQDADAASSAANTPGATTQQAEQTQAQAMKRFEEQMEARMAETVEELQAQQMKELEARAEARFLQETESQAEQAKHLEEQAEARAFQEQEARTKHMKELEARAEARSEAERLKELETRAEERVAEQIQALMEKFEATQMKEFEAQAQARASQRVEEFQERMMAFEAKAEAQATEKAEAHTMKMNELEVQAEASAQAAQMKELEAQTEVQATTEAQGHASVESSDSDGGSRAKRPRPE